MITEKRAEALLIIAICAHDGYLSEPELAFIKAHCFSDQDNDFDALIDNFFETDQTLEEIFFAVTDPLPVLELAAEAAAQDGLDIRENLALQRCLRLAEAKRG